MSDSKTLIARLKESMITILRSDEVYGRTIGMRESIEFLSTVDLASALESLALLNAVAGRLVRESHSLTRDQLLRHYAELYKFLFSADHAPLAVQATARSLTDSQLHQLGFFYPLSPWACAALTDLCLRTCRRDGGISVFPPKNERKFGQVLLAMQKHMAPDHTPVADWDFSQLSNGEFSEFIRNQLRANRHVLNAGDMVRLYALFEIPEIGAVLSRRAGCTPADWFRKQTGLSATDYRIGMFALLYFGHEFSLSSVDTKHLRIDTSVQFQNLTEEARVAFDRLLQMAAIDVEAVQRARKPTIWKEAVYGGSSLLLRQLWAYSPSKYLILDRDFFLERFTKGLVHVLDDLARRSANPDAWKTVRSEYGYLFEGYILWWIRNLFGTTSGIFENEEIVPNHETDSVVVCGQIALIFEANHHPLSRIEAYEADPAVLARIPASDLNKAISAAKHLRNEGRLNGANLSEVRYFLPIAVLPDALPISDITYPVFKRELLRLIPELDGDDIILPGQIVTQEHLEFYDRAWRLPEDVTGLVDHLVARANTIPDRFAPVALERSVIEIRNGGTVWKKLEEAADENFHRHGPSYFTRP